MSKQAFIFLVLAAVISVAYAEESFVVSFGQQCEREKIWNGRVARKTSSIERYFESLQYIQQGYDLDTNIYMVDGYYYNLETLKAIKPEIFKELEVLDAKKDRIKNEYAFLDMTGTVFQHANDDMLLISTRREEDVVALKLSPNHPFLQKVDKELISLLVIRSGNYEYTTVQGAKKVIKKFKEISKEEKVRLDKQKKILEAETEQLASSLPSTINYQNYLWYIYCQGIKKDSDKGLIEPNPDCPCCKGTGKLKCKICNSKGKVGFECESLDVIDVDSQTRKEYEKKIREGQISPHRGNGMDEMMMGFSIMPTSSRRGASRDTRRSSTRRRRPSMGSSDREQLLREKQERLEENRRRAREKRIRDGNVPCCICKKSGYLLCPECILVTKPKYSPHAKEEYLNRWKK